MMPLTAEKTRRGDLRNKVRNRDSNFETATPAEYDFHHHPLSAGIRIFRCKKALRFDAYSRGVMSHPKTDAYTRTYAYYYVRSFVKRSSRSYKTKVHYIITVVYSYLLVASRAERKRQRSS